MERRHLYISRAISSFHFGAPFSLRRAAAAQCQELPRCSVAPVNRASLSTVMPRFSSIAFLSICPYFGLDVFWKISRYIIDPSRSNAPSGLSVLVKKKSKNKSAITRTANAQSSSVKEVIALSVRAVLLLGVVALSRSRKGDTKRS